jgi:hypothetical protein
LLRHLLLLLSGWLLRSLRRLLLTPLNWRPRRGLRWHLVALQQTGSRRLLRLFLPRLLRGLLRTMLRPCLARQLQGLLRTMLRQSLPNKSQGRSGVDGRLSWMNAGRELTGLLLEATPADDFGHAASVRFPGLEAVR